MSASSFRLTPRQREILSKVAEGYAVPEIASDLRVSARTVRTHLMAMKQNADAFTLSEVVMRANRNGQL